MPRKKQHDWYDKWTLGLLGATFIAVFAYTSVAAWQAWLTRRQLSVMQRQLNDSEIQEAASLTIRNFVIEGFPDSTVASFDIVNSGRTRGDQVTMDPVYVWMPATGLGKWLLDEHAFGGRINSSELGFSIEPSEAPRHFRIPIQTTDAFKEFPPEARARLPSKDDIISGRFASIVYIWGTYQDVFGKTHHVVDCLVYTGAVFQTCFASNRHY
jgi:hypothetical protein